MEQIWRRNIHKQWVKHIVPAYANKPCSLLEIGIYEGRGARWFLQNILTHSDSSYTGIDCWDLDSIEQKLVKDKDIDVIRKNAYNVVKEFHGKAKIWEGDSFKILCEKYGIASFDVIYVDGEHSKLQCLRDSLLSYELINTGGIIIWDDYIKRDNNVKSSVDYFLSCIPEQDSFKVLFRNKQFGIKVLRKSWDGIISW